MNNENTFTNHGHPFVNCKLQICLTMFSNEILCIKRCKYNYIFITKYDNSINSTISLPPFLTVPFPLVRELTMRKLSLNFMKFNIIYCMKLGLKITEYLLLSK